MLIFNSNKKKLQVRISWSEQLKAILVAKNHKFIAEHRQKSSSLPSINIQQILPTNLSIIEQHNYTFKKINHTTFSQYIPISQNKIIKNELTDYFPYLSHLQETDRDEYENQIYYISQKIVDNSCYGQWREISKRYLTGLNLIQMFDYHCLLLMKGTQILKEVRDMYNPACLIGAFFLKLLEIQKLINCQKDHRRNTATTIELKDDITLSNLTKTKKNLFCPICLIYDCPLHCLPDNVLSNKCQYIPSRDAAMKMQEKKMSALKLIGKMISLYNNQDIVMQEQLEYCGNKCYKRLNLTTWQEQISSKIKNYSFFFQTMVKMGVQIFHYNPCQIKIILHNLSLIKNPKTIEKLTKPHQSIQCQQIFVFFIKHYNLLQKFHFKFSQSQQICLSNQPRYLYDIKLANKKNILKKITNKDKHYIDEISHHHKSICYHHFLDKDPNDQTCLNCICVSRGYCLPDCLCSREYCSIRLKGCQCTPQSTCWENKCVCFRSMRVCNPQTCYGCFQFKGKKYNCCQNNEEFISKEKKTKIGSSSIPNAGLGLFADQFISKGQFIIRYVGQLVTSSNLQKLRENLVVNNLFYNFKLNATTSIDSRLYGNKSRFINHSKRCSNSIPRKFIIRQQQIIIFYALKNIFEGEQILFNYNGQGSLDQFKDKYPFIQS